MSAAGTGTHQPSHHNRTTRFLFSGLHAEPPGVPQTESSSRCSSAAWCPFFIILITSNNVVVVRIQTKERLSFKVVHSGYSEGFFQRTVFFFCGAHIDTGQRLQHDIIGTSRLTEPLALKC
ncbi:hypothetical protein CesoFtcFv8_009228 [Champsocephalus esox]|uniref:Uncharacterized protein n=2 Tax=Champsocephalus TaxID=52236 RepID=A0AAN8DZ11_CHAGU|nr:hypothetical protein CesoFtcFv8_009228 [Champsocephalus esox]KAK5926893.1 hypothetical protein CgunFtcFv8_022428 [Champsocephalus gunnari]